MNNGGWTVRFNNYLFLLWLMGSFMPIQQISALDMGDALIFSDGRIECETGGEPPANCDQGLIKVVGSYFAIDFDVSGTVEEYEKTPVSANEGIIIGATQPAFGSHWGCPDGSETPSIDRPWCFFANTGMFQTTGVPVTLSQDNGAIKFLDFAGFGVTWNGIPNIPLGGDPGNFLLFRTPLRSPPSQRPTGECGC